MSIPLCVPELRGNEWRYVKECLDTGWVSSAGSYVEKFEAAVADYTGSAHAVACVNGTSALQVSLRALGVGEQDEVIVPTVTFIASVNAIRYVGAVPVFMDCDDYYNIDVEKVGEFLENETEQSTDGCVNSRTGRRVAAIMPVHVWGNAVDMEALVRICEERGLRVLEDATESLGTFFEGGRHTGTHGNVGCLSFNGNKIITTGGGGMVLTDDGELASRLKYLVTQAKDDPVRYVHNEIGYNFRLTNVQAAIGVGQMELLSEFVEVKRRNYEGYRERLAGISGLTLAKVPPYARNNCWMYALRVDRAAYGMCPEELMEYLQKYGIQTRPIWRLNHLQRPYVECQAYEVRRAAELQKQTLMLPCSVGLTEAQQEYVVERLREGAGH